MFKQHRLLQLQQNLYKQQQMASLFNDTQYIRDIAKNMLSPKKLQYQEDFIRYKMMELKHLAHTNFYLRNGHEERLKATLFTHRQIDTNCCVLYLHGFGSHRLEGVTILSSLPPSLSFCCFDFSGSGKSDGSTSTYGIKEYEDIQFVLDKLQEFGYQQFILWGRSMGAVASLLYTSKIKDPRILFQVLDSPFSSFQTIAFHYANKSMNLPQMFINFGIKILKQHFKQHRFNPFSINAEHIVRKCTVPAMFVYCETDKVIPPDNTFKIIENFNPEIRFQRLIIQENHNNIRLQNTLKSIFAIVQKYRLRERASMKVLKMKKGLFEVVSSQITPKVNKTTGDQHKNRRIICSLSKNKVKSKKIKRIKIVNPEQYEQTYNYSNRKRWSKAE